MSIPVSGEGVFWLPVPVNVGDTLSIDMDYGDYLGQAVVISCEQGFAVGHDTYEVRVRFEMRSERPPSFLAGGW